MKWWSFAAAAASSLALLGAPATAYDKNAPAYGNDHVVGWDRGWTKKNPPPPWWNQRLRDNAVYEGICHHDGKRNWGMCEIRLRDKTGDYNDWRFVPCSAETRLMCRDSERRRIHCEVKFDDQLPVEQQKDARCDIQLPQNYIHSTFGD
ncbi:hypothetical protein ACCO45_006960 [Purpureocillium lilacinum]|uniref:Uncharacterized protein n=1 Tax=Purpureocillium lilacinum TaxID=33203 RepID=A0ACC4DRQ9_PURLI